MYKSSENPHIRVFFTGLLAMSYNPEWNKDVVVGLQNGVEGHLLNMVLFENPYEEADQGSEHLKQGLPIFLPPPPPECKIELKVEGGNPVEMSDNPPDNAVVLDGPAWNGNGNDPFLVKVGAYKARFYINSGKIYTALSHPNLIKRQVDAEVMTHITAALAFGVGITLPSSASLSYNNAPQFHFYADSRYELFVSCKPPHSDKRTDEDEESDFLHQYDPFGGIPYEEQYMVYPDGGLNLGVSYRNPCVPIFLSNTEIG